MSAGTVVCAFADLAPGSATRFDVGGVPVAVVRIGDDVYAIGDTCSHADISLSEGEVLRRHGLRNIAAPVLTYLGLQFVFLAEGVVVVETIFGWPGIGHALIHAIFHRDVPMVQGTALVMGLGFVLVNTLVDLAVMRIDPRTHARRKVVPEVHHG